MKPLPSTEVYWRPEANLWWPCADGKAATALPYVLKRRDDSDIAVAACAQRRTCVQAGGHVGLWAMRLAKSFERVLTFEVMPGLLEACRRNTAELANVTVSGLGLSAAPGMLAVSPNGGAGSSAVDPAGRMQAEMTTVDSLGLEDCDLIVLDIEGHEIPALQGATATIARCRPVVHVEERWENRTELPRFMAGLGYREHARIHSDAVYVPA